TSVRDTLSLHDALPIFSFFQTNTLAAEKLYDVVKSFANLKGHEKVLDLYCGTGTIGQYIARQAREVIGMEILQEAIHDANENARSEEHTSELQSRENLV